MSSAMTVLKGDLSVSGTLTGSTYEVRFAGNADMRSRDTLEDFLVELHSKAVAGNCIEVVIDFRGLEFMNSSCFKSFVAWIGRVQDLPAEHRYNMKFLSNAEILWQRRSLHALRCFATDLITVEV